MCSNAASTCWNRENLAGVKLISRPALLLFQQVSPVIKGVTLVLTQCLQTHTNSKMLCNFRGMQTYATQQFLQSLIASCHSCKPAGDCLHQVCFGSSSDIFPRWQSKKTNVADITLQCCSIVHHKYVAAESCVSFQVPVNNTPAAVQPAALVVAAQLTPRGPPGTGQPDLALSSTKLPCK